MKPLFALALSLACAAAQASPHPLPVDSQWNGQTHAQRAAAWWQWAVAQPAHLDPLRDTTGAHCAQGQQGDLFFPVINMVFWRARPAMPLSCEQVRQGAALNNDTALELFVELDGQALENPAQYRVATQECFDLYARLPAGAPKRFGNPAATDGYWILLPPLPAGTHNLKFGGRYNRPGAAYGKTVQDIEYRLEVR
ncbi:hypothetical protein FBY21_0304 [Pseudomonas sp. SLBN-26]|uniref:hypothetical protein n=1 Tax=Pseudomonadaceae TaxID=135621 RepID=UPI0011500A9D|nr:MULTISPECIES: hypothetical protein [Pseudomonas]MCP1615696.1 hypothetical protein [Pseudomonas otitidis]TQL04966.1 hypothetical protein FBY21_0304 [Pseudomonas sp. SLBN-26]